VKTGIDEEAIQREQIDVLEEDGKIRTSVCDNLSGTGGNTGDRESFESALIQFAF
jgi:hypothetical protein